MFKIIYKYLKVLILTTGNIIEAPRGYLGAGRFGPKSCWRFYIKREQGAMGSPRILRVEEGIFHTTPPPHRGTHHL